MEPHLKLWEQADKKIGKDSVNRGAAFETVCKDLGVQIVLRKLKI